MSDDAEIVDGRPVAVWKLNGYLVLTSPADCGHRVRRTVYGYSSVSGRVAPIGDECAVCGDGGES